MAHDEVHHDYHLVDPSPWPIIGSVAAFLMLIGTVFWMHETYNFFGQKRFPEMILHLQSLGFRCADIAGPMFRPADASLWQLDFYFLRSDHPSFTKFGFE